MDVFGLKEHQRPTIAEANCRQFSCCVQLSAIGEAASAGPSLFVTSNASLGHSAEGFWAFARL